MSDQPPTNKRWPIWKTLIFTIGFLVVCYLVYATVVVHDLISKKIPESYAAWTSGNLIVDYLNTHSNEWPHSWEDLDQATNCLRYTPIETLRTKVKIDWNVNFDALLQLARTNPAATPRLVTRLDGSKLDAKWGRDTEPNSKIKDYLLWVLTQTNAPTAVSTSNSPPTANSLR